MTIRSDDPPRLPAFVSSPGERPGSPFERLRQVLGAALNRLEIVFLTLLLLTAAAITAQGEILGGVQALSAQFGPAQYYLLLLGIWAASITAFLVLRVLAATAALRREIQARELAEARAATLARHDSLTGFLNRHALRDEFAATLAGVPQGRSRAMLFLIEIGSLRSVNELYGHSAGDDMLVEVATRLKSVCGADSVAGRMGGNELVLFTAAPDDREGLAASLVARMNAPYSWSGNSLNPGATLGIACYPDHGADYAALMRGADIALHEAKRAGGATYRFYNSDLEGGASERIAKMKGRVRVLRAGEERPAFISHARTDLLVREACRAAEGWAPGTALVLKLSSAEWQEDWTAERIVTQLDMHGLERAACVLEVSESVFLSRAGATLSNLQALQKAGVRIALCDFANGFNPTTSSIRFDLITVDNAYLGAGLAGNERKLLERRA